MGIWLVKRGQTWHKVGTKLYNVGSKWHKVGGKWYKGDYSSGGSAIFL